MFSQFLRTPYAPFYSFAARPGYLRIYGSPTVLGDRDTPALVLRKQNAFSQLFSTTVEFAPASTREEAGALCPSLPS
jgi:beta-xylosidase